MKNNQGLASIERTAFGMPQPQGWPLDRKNRTPMAGTVVLAGGDGLDAAQCVDDWHHGLWIVGAVDHRCGQILAKGATGTGCAAVEIAFAPAALTSEVVVDNC